MASSAVTDDGLSATAAANAGPAPSTGTVPPHPKSRARARKAIRSRPTINDVAAAAGVSRGTVSRVLNGGRYVSPSALTAVNRAMMQTGYVVNRNARSLVTKRAGCVAFVLAEPPERLFDDPNFNVLIRSATHALARHDVNLTLMIAGDPHDRARIVRYLQSDHVDGVLLVSTHSGDAVIPELLRAGVPIVACGKPLGYEDSVPYVAADDRTGARTMTKYLLGLGRTRIATITGPLDTPGGLERLEGYCDGIGKRVRHDFIANGDYSYESGELAMDELLGRNPDLDAVFVASDVMAAGALATLRRRGISVPDAVAVAGFDDSRIALTTEPPLTTMRQPLPEIAERMVEILLALVYDQQEPESVTFNTELIRRASA
jgi:DNA-binding LacI/PurR family transcriptional regulator